jgi:WD40 repeat protein
VTARVRATLGDRRVEREFQLAVKGPLTEIWCFKELRSVVLTVALSPDRKRGVSYGPQDGTLTLWDLAAGKKLREMGKGHLAVQSVSFVPDDLFGKVPMDFALSGGPEVMVWDVSTGTEVRRFGGPQEYFRRVAVSPDGRYCLAAGKSAVQFYNIATGNKLWQFAPTALSVGFTADGARALVAAHNEITVCDAKNGKVLSRFRTIPANESFEDTAFSANGKRAVTLSHHETFRVWDVETGKILHTHQGLNNPQSVAVSADGSRALLGMRDGYLLYWDLDAGRQLYRFKGHSSIVKSVALSADGSHALTGGWDNTVRFWELEK